MTFIHNVNIKLPIISFVTDFGQKDWYVGTMKLNLVNQTQNQCQIIDICHEIPKQNVSVASFSIWNAYTYMPSNSILLCVVDPGVGTDRKVVIYHDKKYERYIVGPYNGFFDLVLAEHQHIHTYIVDEEYLTRQFKQVSSTFHGRDIFVPLVAKLINGEKIPVQVQNIQKITSFQYFSTPCEASIIYVDDFGNLILDIKQGEILPVYKYKNQQILFYQTYGQVNVGEPLLLKGSSGLIELSINQGNAAQYFNKCIGDSIYLTK